MSLVAVDFDQCAYPEAGAEGTVSKEAALSNHFSKFSRELFLRVLTAGVGAGVRFSWTLSEIDRSFPESRRSECGADFPSQHALKTAANLLFETDQILPTPVSVSDIEGFEGDLILHWRSGDKGAALVFPAEPSRVPKLYREHLKGDVAAETVLISDPQPSEVSSFIQWVRPEA